MQDYLLVKERSAFSMLPPPLNLFPSAFAVIHYPLIYVYQKLQRSEAKLRNIIAEKMQSDASDGDIMIGEDDSSSPRKQTDVPHKNVLSVSGTVSDMVIG